MFKKFSQKKLHFITLIHTLNKLLTQVLVCVSPQIYFVIKFCRKMRCSS